MPKTPKGRELMVTPIVADGPFAGSRAIKVASTNGLGPAFADERAEIAVVITDAQIPVNAFALLEGRADVIERGISQSDFAAARKNALALGKAIEPLDRDTTWASKSLTKAPVPREPVLHGNDEVRAQVFQQLLTRVGAGEASLDVLSELARSPARLVAPAAIGMVRPGEPGLPDWYWHPGLSLPEGFVDQAHGLHDKTEERVELVDHDISRARIRLLFSLFDDTQGADREAVLVALANGAKKLALLDDAERGAFAEKVLVSLESEWTQIESLGDSYARVALRFAVRHDAARAASLVDASPKGWKTLLKASLKRSL